jgi:hypothetical protein
MILRPLEPLPPRDQEFHPAWPVVEGLQRRKYESCWMITQPSHAALAAEIAAKLKSPLVPALDAGLLRAIALHDAGWGMPDAQAIMRGRAQRAAPPKSFVELGIMDFLDAWSQSIEIAQSASPAGGYIVSRHFWRLAGHRIAHGADEKSDRKRFEDFLTRESQRQEKLASKQTRTADELGRLTDVLQLCDLLSLYFCSGAEEKAELPPYFGVAVRLQKEGKSYRLEPRMVEPGSQFVVAALRHPAAQEESAREIQIKIE